MTTDLLNTHLSMIPTEIDGKFYLTIKKKSPKTKIPTRKPVNTSTRSVLKIKATLDSSSPEPNLSKSLLQQYRDGKLYPVYQFPEAKIPIMKGEFFYQPKTKSYLVDPSGWWISEKLDGIRAIWTGKELLTSQGNQIPAPDWFIHSFPQNIALDGELYLSRNQFYELVSIAKNWEASINHPEDWKKIRYHVFDIPDAYHLTFEQVQKILKSIKHKYIVPIPQIKCRNLDHLLELQREWVKHGAEGSMLRRPETHYQIGRSKNILKFKSQWDNGNLTHLLDDQAIIIGYKYNYEKAQPDKHLLPIRSLLVRWADPQKFPLNPEFNVSHCITQDQKKGDYQKLFPIGQKIRVLYTQLIQDTQKPRFPRYDGWVTE